jgi:hypothetical protein
MAKILLFVHFDKTIYERAAEYYYADKDETAWTCSTHVKRLELGQKFSQENLKGIYDLGKRGLNVMTILKRNLQE